MFGQNEGFVGMAAAAAVALLGWAICMVVLLSAFFLGHFAAGYLGNVDRDAAGLLSAIAVVWLYEHRVAHDRWKRLLNKR